MKTVVLLLISTALLQAEPPRNGLGYETATALKGTFDEKAQVFKTVYRRLNKNITVDSVQLDQAFFGLNTWAAFTPTDDQFLLTGEFVLFQDEVNPLLTFLLDHSIAVASLATRFFNETPRTYFMTISATGSLAELGKTVKGSFELLKSIRQRSSQVGPILSMKNSLSNSKLNPTALDKIFGFKGEYKEGMLKYVVGRTVTLNSVSIGAEMGACSRAVFTGIDANAFVDGEVALLESELQSTLKELRKADFTIYSINRHLIGESPQLYFVHFSAHGKASELAKTVRQAIKS